MPLCFAYGSNMDAAAMAVRCPKSRVIGLARLLRHRFVITPEGYASVARHPSGCVHGVLWDLALSDMRALDAYENLASGLYRKLVQPVAKAAGGAARAIVYVGRGEGGRPQPGYMEGVAAAARDWGLPSDYVARLEALSPGAAMRAQAAAPAPRVRPRFATPFDAQR